MSRANGRRIREAVRQEGISRMSGNARPQPDAKKKPRPHKPHGPPASEKREAGAEAEADAKEEPHPHKPHGPSAINQRCRRHRGARSRGMKVLQRKRSPRASCKARDGWIWRHGLEIEVGNEVERAECAKG